MVALLKWPGEQLGLEIRGRPCRLYSTTESCNLKSIEINLPGCMGVLVSLPSFG